MLNRILAYVGYLILFINVIYYFKSFSYLGKAFKVFLSYLVVIFAIQITSTILWYNHINNIFLSHIYFLLQFILLSFFYKEILRVRALINIGLVIIPILLLSQYFLEIKLLNQFNLFEVILTCVPILLVSLIFYFKRLTNTSLYLYINTGVFLYLLSSILVYMSASVTTELSRAVNKYMWRFNSILYIIFQLFIFYEWYKNIRHYKEVTEID